MPEYIVRHSRGATDPDLEYTCAYTDETVQDLTGATVNFVYASSNEGIKPAPGYTRMVSPMTITDASAGQVSYQWGSPLIDTEGFFVAQVHVTLGAELIVFPEPGVYISIQILDSLALPAT